MLKYVLQKNGDSRDFTGKVFKFAGFKMKVKVKGEMDLKSEGLKGVIRLYKSTNWQLLLSRGPHKSCKCLDLMVISEMIPVLVVWKAFGLTKVFWLVETNCLLL
jgi:hypothetical protein